MTQPEVSSVFIELNSDENKKALKVMVGEAVARGSNRIQSDTPNPKPNPDTNPDTNPNNTSRCLRGPYYDCDASKRGRDGVLW